MEMTQNTSGNEKSPSNRESRQGPFEPALERLDECRRSHGLAEQRKNSRAPSTHHVKKESVASELHQLSTTLLKIRHVLNLIQERGTVLLPRNWQN